MGKNLLHTFVRLERPKFKTPICNLKVRGHIVSDPLLILKELHNFYLQLYSSEIKKVNTDYFKTVTFPSISIEDRDMLDMPLTLQEVEIAIKQLKVGKCPGLDGFSIEFYSKLLPELKYILHSLYLRIIDDQELHTSAKEGIISLLEKPNKDQLKIENLRPLTLLCCDYKIFSKIISNHLQLVIDKLIHYDQSGFLRNRFIAQNLVDLTTVVQVAQKNQEDIVIAAVDFRKAYDSVEWPAMLEILKCFGFGEEIIKWIKICITGIKSYVINNGYLSDSIELSRGLRQGDPLSCLLFDLVIEIIAIKIRNNQDIEGITIRTITEKVGQYADDMWVSLKNTHAGIVALFKELELFGRYVGLKVNFDKTEMFRVGSLHNAYPRYYVDFLLHWSDRPIKVLGIYVSGNYQEMISKNYNELLDKVTNICKIWAHRSMTLLGRITIVNTLIIPILLYRLQVLPSPSKVFFAKLRQTISYFLWEGKKPKMSYKKLIQSYEKGGLKLQDPELKNVALKKLNGLSLKG